MAEQDPEAKRGITPPPNTQLPFFAYGALKPAEPAHHQIKGFLQSAPVRASIQGSLWVRDGLPLLKMGGGVGIQGFLLHFSPEHRTRAYETIGRFEPRKHYYWQESSVLRSSIRANVLVGKKLERGRAAQVEANSWKAGDDPVFRFGLDVVRASIESDANMPFESAPPDNFDWPRFFRLQMAYLLLWSAIERYTAFLLGPGLDPTARIKEFGRHDVFQAAFKEARVTRTDEVSDSRDPEGSFSLDPVHPCSAVLYYYQVRNNLSHRGKGAWADGEIVRKSLRELKAIFDAVLSSA